MGKSKNSECELDSPGRNVQVQVIDTPKLNVRSIAVEGTAFSIEEIVVYAKALLDGSGAKDGDAVSITVSDPSQKPLIKAMTLEAYDRGILLEVFNAFHLSSNEELEGMADRVDQVVENDGVFIDLTAFKGESGEVHQDHAYGDFEARAEAYSNAWSSYTNRTEESRWNMAPWPTKEWAEQVFPGDPQGFRKLSVIVAKAIHADKGQEARLNHIQKLKERGEKLTAMNIKTVKLVGPGTELEMDIREEAAFLPTAWETDTGETAYVNNPSDEVFTTPDPESTKGTFKLTRPVVLGVQDPEGNPVQYPVQNVTGTFENGVMKLSSPDEFDQLVLDSYFNEERGTNKLGELGLVDQSGPLAKCGATFFNTLLDEQTGVHLGVGKSFGNITGGASERDDLANHFDLVIGSDEMKVVGVDADGNEHDLISDGLWNV